ncbi:PASTA domain-containing protein [Hallella multisaccharivorax DSM 17128]|uniref:PASTA domain containing protein n=1 Tax=Hallella multisaccharivorax DSM 17128 TaxID=688246 RepID=F8N6P8_9BACT|nr:PASTA domain-containing protein [Hallella multisaccharivorax]EGN56263.1 PASTA domain containing protein [Hallella multisaccharivorax DSM 17128]GJG29777.1 PASTA domain-containing protein [Hallella multisaccharivorax DSM 17128]
MSISEFIGKFKSKMLWGNLFAMALVIVGLAVGFRFAVDIYTHHGEAVTIPNLTHQKFENAEEVLSQLGLNIVVSDTGYIKTLPPGCILEQYPAPGERVKPGRTVFVTINATQTPTISLPDVIDNCSLREAMAKLTAIGFKLNPPQFIPGEKDWVYGIIVNGKHVVYGDRIPVDARLTIQAGNGMRSASDSVNYIDPTFNTNDDNSEDVDEFEEVNTPDQEDHSQKKDEPDKDPFTPVE